MFRINVPRRPARPVTLAFLAVAALAIPDDAFADEGGVSFWLPGLFGSLAAAPQVPGWALGIVNYYTSVGAAGSVAASREVTIGRFNPTVNVNLNANLNGSADLVVISPSYVFATPVFGAQFAASMAAYGGRNSAEINGTLTASAGAFTATRQGSISDSLTALGDLFPQISLRWNAGVNNWMLYGMGDIPVGNYNSANLSNLGIGHGAVDGGAGYTYFDPKAGHEFSVVSGLTGNVTNSSTGYTNGIDWHTDWAASQFVSKTVFIGAVGYFYQQITPDTGAAAFLGAFESRVAGLGPQLGIIIPAGRTQVYLNFKAYWEFAAENRPSGWNGWVTLAFSPSAAPAATPTPPIITK
jgi:hypothetical protein